MKVFRFLVLFFVSLTFLFSMSAISNVEAGIWPTSAATLCWKGTGDVPPGTVIMKLRSFPIGGSNYLLSGKITVDNKTHNIVNGNAVVGTNVLMTINAAGKDAEAMWRSTCYIVLSGTTLNGKVECIGHDYNRADLSIDTQFSTASVTKITCP